jgi:hypothetical protein
MNSSIGALAINSSGSIFAGTLDSGIYRSMDNGANWMQINNGLINMGVVSLTIDSNGIVFAGTVGDGLFRSTDNGTNWVQVGLSNAFLGDLDLDGSLTPYDVVLAINCVFLGQGFCAQGYADVNCDRSLTPADVVLFLLAVFAGQPLPCP